MSLDYNLADIPDRKAVCYDDDGDMRGTTQTIIFATMAVGIGDTVKHADEFVWRVMFFEKINGALGYTSEGPTPIPESELRAHIGLRTNVSHETRAAWLKRTAERHFHETITNAQQMQIPV